jgi:AAA ATPase domain
MQDIPIPVQFRSEIIQPLLKALSAGESCSLVGVGSSGKSNLIRQLLRQDVREHFLGESAHGILLLYVDCTKLLDYTLRALHGLILEAMLHATEKGGTELVALHPKLERLWEQATGSESPDRTRRALEEAMASVLQAGTAQIYVILDDFDHVAKNAPTPALNSLRALRDNHKYQVMYITVTRHELAFLRAEGEYEDFYEIVSFNTIPIGPYTEADANDMIDRLVSRWEPASRPSAAERQRLLEASGRHAGLLRQILWVAQSAGQGFLLSPDLIEKLRGHRDVEPECIKIWDSLEKDEKANLLALVGRRGPISKGIRQLEVKGLVRYRLLDGTYDIFSPVFDDYVRGTLPGGRVPIELVPDRREVWVEDRLVSDLDKVEYHLFTSLYRSRGQPVTQPDLVREMIDVETTRRRFPGPPEQRLDAYMEELKRKIDTAHREYIIHEPDRGYRLIGPDGT